MSFDCSIAEWSISGKSYTCRGTVQSFGDRSVIENVFASHQNYKLSDWFVKSLRINHQRITTIPKKIETFFPALKILDFENSDISTVSKDDLLPFPLLETIDFENNKLTAIPSDFFEFVPLLKSANFRRNKITSVGTQLLKPTPLLKVVDLRDNPCMSFLADNPEKIEELKQLLRYKC